MGENLESDFFVVWLLTPFLIFVARIFDVSMGTVRIILISKGFKKLAPLLGFFESMIWILAVSQIMQHLNNVLYYFAYAVGFATGTYLGMIIEEKLSLGYAIIRVIIKNETNALISKLREKEFSVTVLDAEGNYGRVGVLFLVLKRIQTNEVIELIKEYNSKAFYTIEDVKFVSGGIFPSIESANFKRFKWTKLPQRK